MMNYDKDKELQMADVHRAFINFIGYNTLTVSERLFVEYLWEHVKNELMKKGDVE